MSVLLLPNNVQALAPLVSKESARYALTGFRIEETKLEKATKYRVEATNGRVLGRIEGIADDVSDYPVNVIPGLATAPNTATSAVVPAKPFIEMCKKARSSKSPKAILRNVACVLSTDQVTLASTDLEQAGGTQTTRVVEGRWPTTDEVVSKKKPQRSFFIDPQLMIDVLKAASEVRDMPENVSVRMDIFEGPHACIEIKAFKPGQRFLGIIVPLTKGSKDNEQKWDRGWRNSTALIGEELTDSNTEFTVGMKEKDADDEEAESEEETTEEEATEEVSNPAEPEEGDEVDNPQPTEPVAEPQAEVELEPVIEPEPVAVSKPPRKPRAAKPAAPVTPQVPQSAFDMAKEMAAKFAK